MNNDDHVNNIFNIDGKWITKRKKKLESKITFHNRYDLLDVQQIGEADNYDDGNNNENDSTVETRIPHIVKCDVNCFINQKPERDNKNYRPKNVIIPSNLEHGKITSNGKKVCIPSKGQKMRQKITIFPISNQITLSNCSNFNTK